MRLGRDVWLTEFFLPKRLVEESGTFRFISVFRRVETDLSWGALLVATSCS